MIEFLEFMMQLREALGRVVTVVESLTRRVGKQQEQINALIASNNLLIEKVTDLQTRK